MIRVGFVLTLDAAGWLGGISYFRNLLGALVALPERRIEPVIFAGQQTDAAVLRQFPDLQIVRSSALDAQALPWQMRRVATRLIGRDIGLERLLRRHGVSVLSHQGFFGPLGKVAVLGWLPDFQEHHLPQFFSAAQLRARTRKRVLFCRASSRVLLSSHDARADLQSLDSSSAANAVVLQFVADAVAPSVQVRREVAQRLKIDRPYFHLPNQFWSHKNHRIVVDALQLLKSRGMDALVIATGNTSDHRQPGQFGELMAHVEAAGVTDRFLAVGAVSYQDVVALMAGAVAVINPSRFEGWSTTVEEAKSLGKRVLLSDLRVHREQAPSRGSYFAPDDAETLAKLMAETLSSHSEEVDALEMERATRALPERRQAFARCYQDIVLGLDGGRRT